MEQTKEKFDASQCQLFGILDVMSRLVTKDELTSAIAMAIPSQDALTLAMVAALLDVIRQEFGNKLDGIQASVNTLRTTTPATTARLVTSLPRRSQA
jgi:hypothetical protein